jgi:thymidylate synthase (FAD)
MNEVLPTVELVRATPHSAEVIASAARLCYASDTDGLFGDDSGDADKLVRQLIRRGHLSPLEHASFTFYIQGVSRAMTHQLVRHRIASYSQRSQRYVTHDEFDYVVPPRLHGKKVVQDGAEVDAVEYYRDTMALIAARYAALNDALGRSGESSNEDARYVLPNACETKIVVTMNARVLLHFFSERLCNRAQWEIRAVAEQMRALVAAECPEVFRTAGPKCLPLHGCPEGPASCGRYAEMVERYGNG